MFNSKLLGIGFICTMCLSVTAEAKLYKWVDDKGTTHYGEVIPPEYANKERDTIKKSGLLEKKAEKVDPASVRAKEEAEQKKKIEDIANLEEKRRNNTLLNTYSNEHEIDLARERSLVLINARIESNKMLLKSTQGSLDELNKEAEARTKTGRKIPVSLTKDMAHTKERSDKYAAELAKSEVEFEEVKKRFGLDKELYKKLKGSN